MSRKRKEKANARLKFRMHAFNRNQPPRLPIHRLMNLRQTRHSNRFRVKRAKESAHRLTGFGEEELFEFVERGGETLVLEGLHGEGPGGGDELNGREVLAELSIGRLR